jgi:hypothetical protein
MSYIICEHHNDGFKPTCSSYMIKRREDSALLTHVGFITPEEWEDWMCAQRFLFTEAQNEIDTLRLLGD